MPQQTIYIRNDDMPKWKALKNKSAFLSAALNGISLEDAKKRPKPPLSKGPRKINPLDIPGVTTAVEAECPRHHLPFIKCAHKH